MGYRPAEPAEALDDSNDDDAPAGNINPAGAAAGRPLPSDLAAPRYLVVIGMANDMLGYIIPKAHWDAWPPFTTDDNTAPYGELISAGPKTAAQILAAFESLE